MIKMRLLQGRKIPIITALGIFGLNIFLDRITKYLAVEYLKGRPPLRLFHDILILTYVENTGAFLSLGAQWNIYLKTLLFLIIPIAVCGAGLLYMMLRERRIRCIIIAGCILGGGIGNLTDRLFNGFRVIDFMNFGIGGLRTGVLNTADLSVTFGVITLLLAEILPKPGKNKGERRHEQT